MIRPAIIFTNYGPYHVARASALAKSSAVDPIFIELASVEKLYPWVADKSAIVEKLHTLEHQPYEDCSSSMLTRKLIDVLNTQKPDALVIAGYSEAPMRAAAKWARANGKHVVVMSDSTRQDYKRHWWREVIKRIWISQNVDAGFVGGKLQREYLAGLGVPDECIWEHYDVVDNNYFADQAETIHRSDERDREREGLPANYFLYVGRFSPEKNLSVLLRAYKTYQDSSSAPWGLVLVGDGAQRDELRSIASAEGLNNVVWPGFKYFHELPLYYAFASCFVLPSTREPWGLVVNEAMASGLPVLVSNACGCAPDLVSEGENGFTFDPEDTDYLADLMRRVSTSTSEQLEVMSEASREIVSHFTPQHWAESLTLALTSACK